MNEEAKRICEELDAALFSSDTFLDDDSMNKLSDYIERWKRNIDEYWRNKQA